MTHHEVTKDMTIAEVLRHNPKTAPVFMRLGMQCLGCASSTGETIAQAAMVHGIDVDTLIKELNNA
jgi:hybrid cluster-associated redox disulfide protein